MAVLVARIWRDRSGDAENIPAVYTYSGERWSASPTPSGNATTDNRCRSKPGVRWDVKFQPLSCIWAGLIRHPHAQFSGRSRRNSRPDLFWRRFMLMAQHAEHEQALPGFAGSSEIIAGFGSEAALQTAAGLAVTLLSPPVDLMAGPHALRQTVAGHAVAHHDPNPSPVGAACVRRSESRLGVLSEIPPSTGFPPRIGLFYGGYGGIRISFAVDDSVHYDFILKYLAAFFRSGLVTLMWPLIYRWH